MVQKPLHRLSQCPPCSAEKDGEYFGVLSEAPALQSAVEQGKPYKKIAGNNGNSTNYGKFTRSGSGSEDGLRFPGNVLTFPAVQRTVHPTQKPVALCEYFIKTYTRPGEVVADICAGSATTAVAALNTGRRFIFLKPSPPTTPPPQSASVWRGQRWRREKGV